MNLGFGFKIGHYKYFYTYVYLYWTLVTVFMLAIYNASTFLMIHLMYKHHRYEYENHIKPMLWLFIFSEVSIVFFLLTQIYGFY